MKVTKMRIKGQKVGGERMADIVFTLKRRLERAGFVTAVSVASDSGLKIGLHMHTFHIDTRKHDRNLRHNPHTGYKLTTTPTWDQRVKFNDIINAVLNKFRVSANVKSGDFVIRSGLTCMLEHDWLNQKPDYICHNESRGYYIEACDEKQYLEERRLARNRQAKVRRLLKQNRQVDAAKVSLSIVGGAE